MSPIATIRLLSQNSRNCGYDRELNICGIAVSFASTAGGSGGCDGVGCSAVSGPTELLTGIGRLVCGVPKKSLLSAILAVATSGGQSGRRA
jgi:hypothetical protein